MTALASPIANAPGDPDSNPNNRFLEYVPVVETHAAISFRHLPETEREEAVAESLAAAFLNFVSARRRGTLTALKPSRLAHYAVLHTRNGKHVGGSMDSKRDVMSFRAQKAGNFQVHRLPWDDTRVYDVLKAPEHVWRQTLLEDRRTPVADQVRFRLDFSSFVARQHDRTRTAMALLAAGDRRSEVAEKLNVTPSAITQRMAKVEREWLAYQGDGDANPPASASIPAVDYRPFRLGEPGQSATEPRTAA